MFLTLLVLTPKSTYCHGSDHLHKVTFERTVKIDISATSFSSVLHSAAETSLVYKHQKNKAQNSHWRSEKFRQVFLPSKFLNLKYW